MRRDRPDHPTDGMGRQITVGCLVTADVPICCAIRRGPGYLSDVALEMLDRTRDGRTCGIATDEYNGTVDVLWPDGSTTRVPRRLLRVEAVGIEVRRNARMAG